MPPAASSVPPLPASYLHRSHIVDNVLEAVMQRGNAVVTGPRQVGKTTTAIDVTNRHGGRWLWIDIALHENATETLRRAALELSLRDDYEGLVIDGMLVIDARGSLAPALASLLAVTHPRDVKVILTADRQLGASLQTAAQMNQDATVLVAGFDESEIRRYLVQRGCNTTLADAWSHVLLLTTAGEPLLVQARIAMLEARSFPEPRARDLFETAPEVDAARRDMRLAAVETLDEGSAELLNRLSLGGHPYRRETVIEIGAAEPPIASPGIALDRLLGAWVQQVDGRFYRVASLAVGFGVAAHGQSWACSMHRIIARAMLAFQNITTGEAADALFHAALAEEDVVMNGVLNSLFVTGYDLWTAFAASASWLPAMWVGEATRPAAFSPQTWALIRLAQIRIAILNDGTLPAPLLEAFDAEYPSESADRFVQMTRFLGLAEVLMHARTEMPVEVAVRFTAEWSELFNEMVPTELQTQLAESVPHFESDPLAFMGFLCLSTVKSPLALHDLVESLHGYDRDFTRRFYSVCGGDRGLAHGFVSQIWVPAVREDRSDWSSVIGGLRSAFELFQATGLGVLSDVVADAMVRVTTDFGSGASDALALSNELSKASHAETPDLRGAHAHALYVANDYPGALAIWRDLLPNRIWDGIDLSPYNDYREAAKCEVELGDWDAAAHWLERAADRVNVDPNLLWKCALEFDAAFARWSSGDTIGTVDPLRRGAALLVQLIEDPGISAQFMVLKRIGHTLMWMTDPQHSAKSGFSAPPPAAASWLDTDLPPNEPVPPPTSIDMILAYVLKYVYLVGGPDDLADIYEARVLASETPVARVLGYWTATYRAASVGATVGFVRLLAASHAAMAELQASNNSSGGRIEPPPAEVVMGAIVPGLRGFIDAHVLQSWRTGARECGIEDGLRAVLDMLDGLFARADIDPREAMSGSHGDLLLQVLGTVRYASVATPSVSGWLRLHGVWANFFAQFAHRELAGAMLLRLVVERWNALSEQRFALSAPSVSAPALKAALLSTGTPWQRIRAILSAAETAASASC